jgi:methionyl-tRNA formyltransferase
MRVALFARVPDVVVQLDALLRELGHECVGVVTTEGPGGRYGGDPLSALTEVRPPHLDVLVASRPARFAKLLSAGGAALRSRQRPSGAAAALRGPNPIGWALRNGDTEFGFTFHRMDADFDTGHLLVQGAAPLAGAERAEDVLATLFGLAALLLPRALERVEAGDPGDAQSEEGASYAGFFEPEFAEVDWTRPAEEVHRQVRAWWMSAARNGVRGPRAEVGGERVYVLRTRLDAYEGGTRVECGDGPIWVLETAPAPVEPSG